MSGPDSYHAEKRQLRVKLNKARTTNEFCCHSEVTQQFTTYLYILSHIDTCNLWSLLCPVRRVGLNQMQYTPFQNKGMGALCV